MPVNNRIQLRRGTSTQWSDSLDKLAAGELGWDTTENNVKIGDGSNYWADLPWLVVAGVSGQIINPAVISGVSGIFFDTSVGDVDQIAGQLGWNSEAGTFDVGLTDDLKISVGQSLLFRVKNSTGNTITKGEAVYASGVLGGGQVIQVAPFAADETVPEVRFIGLMLDDLANGEDGFVAEFGHIKNVDLRTTNTVLNPNAETWAIGDILFVDGASAGGLTKVQPKNDIYVALVLADGQNGELFVRITNPGHINDLHDVNTSGLVDNNLLVWNSGLDTWEPTTSLTFNGTTLHTDTDGVSAIFGRNNALTSGGKVRIYVDDSDTAGSVQAIKAYTNKTTGTNIGINATANGSGATKNIGLYGWADQATTNWGLWVDRGYSILDDRLGIKTSSPSYDLHVVGSGNFTGDLIIGGDLTINGTTVIANVDTMEVADPVLTLGLSSGNVVTNTNLDRGIALALNDSTMGFMGWDTSENEFSLLSSGVASNGSGNYAPGTYGDLHIGNLEATDGYFSGNVGIGTTSPSEKLHVAGDVLIDGGGTTIAGTTWDNGLLKIGTSSAGISIDTNEIFSSDIMILGTLNASSSIEFRHGNTVRIKIISGGNVGIGTTSPSYKLDVNGTAGFSSTINASNIGTGQDNSVVILDSDGKLRTDEIDSRVWGSTLVDGAGIANYVSKWTDSNTLTNSVVYDDGTNVGIGLTNPTEKLDVSGNANISGHLSASTKSFLINHPTKAGKKLQYGSLESPYHGVRLTGKAKLVEGVCVVELPGYISELVHEEDVNIQITNYKHHKTLYVDEIDIPNNSFTIKGYRCKTLGELEFFWSFTAIRKDVPELTVEK